MIAPKACVCGPEIVSVPPPAMLDSTWASVNALPTNSTSCPVRESDVPGYRSKFTASSTMLRGADTV